MSGSERYQRRRPTLSFSNERLLAREGQRGERGSGAAGKPGAIVRGVTISAMKVLLRNPRREVEIAGGRRVKDVLKDLHVVPESVIVIRGDTLITADQVVDDADTIELRPVMSGGSASRAGASGEASPSMIEIRELS